MMTEQQRAIHEIGHVLAGVAYGWQIQGVGLDNGAAGQGAADVRVPCEDTLLAPDFEHGQQQAQEWYEQSMVQLAAGAAAEEMLLGGSQGEGSIHESESDWGHFNRLRLRWEASAHSNLKLRFGESAPFSTAKTEAMALIRDSNLEPLLSELSKLLIEKRYLTGEEILVILSNQWQRPEGAGGES